MALFSVLYKTKITKDKLFNLTLNQISEPNLVLITINKSICFNWQPKNMKPLVSQRFHISSDTHANQFLLLNNHPRKKGWFIRRKILDV